MFFGGVFFFFFFFAHGFPEYESFLNKSIWSINVTLTGTTSDQSGPGNNDNEGILHNA